MGGRPTPPPNGAPRYQAPDFQYTPAEIERIGNTLSDYELDRLPPHLKRQGEDWHAIFNPNPRVPRRLDVELVHNLAHQSVVCCVRFSHDGRHVATGCNRSAQIFDVVTGAQICHLQDTNTNQEGDLYIRSVCFSPDGKYLATGAEDKIIRVSLPFHLNLESACLPCDVIPGLGHPKTHHPPPIHRPRAGHLLPRLRRRRPPHRFRVR